MNLQSIIAISDDNAPYLRELETTGPSNPRSVQLACRADENTCYFINFTGYRSGLDAEAYRPDPAEINRALVELIASAKQGDALHFETGEPPNPGREFSVDARDKKHRTIVHTHVLTASPLRIETPSVPQLRQLFFFLSRCHPLG